MSQAMILDVVHPRAALQQRNQCMTLYVPVSQIHTEAWGESEQTHAHWVHWPTEEGYPYVSNAWPEPQQEEPRGHIGGASRAMPTASNASSS